MKKILGLDLGTNSIGWALIEQNFEERKGSILGMGSRIIPMSQDILGEFDKGNSISQTAERTRFRGARRLRERHLLRRERLHRVLDVLGFLPEHYSKQIDFENRLGKFKNESEPKIAYKNKEFIFKESFNEMLADFKTNQPELVKNNNLIPYDWTIYFLRKKALTKRILKEEIAWIILNFNKKRGYYQVRGKDEIEDENPNKLIEFHSLKIVDVVADENPNAKGDLWYSLFLENGWIYRRASKTPMFDWKDKVRDFIVTTDLNDDGSVKTDNEGVEKRSFRAPAENDWNLIKKKTEKEIEISQKTVGAYIYDTLLQKPGQKIKGKLVRTIERKFYKDELIKILKKQIELQPSLFTEELLHNCIMELYKNNEAHRQQLSARDFVHLFVNDIIFYQRPLRSQKSNISRCTLEFREYKLKNENGDTLRDENGKEIYKKKYLKAIPKSHPLFQEFRLWQWLYNLKLFTKEDDKDVTLNFIKTKQDIENLFDFLNDQEKIKQDNLVEFFIEKTGLKGKALKNEAARYRWNYVEDKEYPCNETGSQIRKRLLKVENIPENFLTKKKEIELWHIIYSVTDKIEFEKALNSFAEKNNLNAESFVENFKKIKPYDSQYGAYSLKAIKKLLPLMRIGKYWNRENIDENTKERIDKIINGEYDEKIKDRVREKAIHLQNHEDFQGLQLWLAQYIVYDRHSEVDTAGKWNSADDLEDYLQKFKQHSLRNPIVEQIVTETLRVVRDIWQKYGSGTKDYINEIHIELGREMKNTADDRKRLTNIITENETTNQRIKAFLAELFNDENVENVRPYSPVQQEALKIFEEGVLKSDIDIPDDILKISKSAQPTKSEFHRYKLWIEQKYRSPYTGVIIPLNKLFTPAYEIEHIIPQSRYFDDSFSNKVICESAVNKLKDRQLGFEFIKNHHGEKVETGFGETVTVFTEEAYKVFVNNNYSNNRAKRNKLLMDNIPEKMIERQLNDTRYISKFISELLSNIVRSEKNDEGYISKNVLPGNGKVTSLLRQDWGLNDVWNDLILPRFERMNELTGSNVFTAWNENHQKFLPSVPLELAKGFQKKRIDHRHHALDALVIACATRDHINLLNNQAAKSENSRYDLQHKLRQKETYFNENQQKQKIVFKDFYKPWETFTQDAKNKLENIVVSFKQNLRVINKTSNKYQKYVKKNDRKVKEYVPQTKGDSWAIRKPMHKDTVSGIIKLRKKKNVSLSSAIDTFTDIADKKLRKKIIELFNTGYDKKRIIKFFKDRENKWNGKDISRVDIYYWENDNVASRVPLDTTFNEKKIESITDSGIKKILSAHLNKYKEKDAAPETLAFTPEGIEELNRNITTLNNGKPHQPIFKVRTYEPLGNKFTVGETGNKKTKYVEAAKGTNLFFAIYQDENGKRNYETIPLNVIIERQKQGMSPVPEINDKEQKLLFHLSPNDLVCVLEKDEVFDVNYIDPDKIYKFTDSSDTTGNFIPAYVSDLIFNLSKKEQNKRGLNFLIQNEFGLGSPQSKNQKSIEGIMIKENCLKLNIDRLGNVLKL